MPWHPDKKPVLDTRHAVGPFTPARLYAAFAVCLAAMLVYLSETISFRDQGDFARAVGGMLKFPEGGIGEPSQMRWNFHAGGLYPLEQFNLAAYVFRAAGAAVREMSASFHLSMVSVPAKVLVVAAIHLLASFYARQFEARYRVQAAAFGVLAIAVFQAHNIGMLKSFYSEVLFLVFFPALLAALVGWPRKGAGSWIVAASIGVGLTKTQYFYVPLLALACLLAIRWGKERVVPWRFVALMLVAQALCVLTPLAVPLVLTGLVLPWLLRRTDRAMLAPALLFLSVFVVTQAVISLMGEGIRDLSKHLWAAQLALDLLVVALLGQAGFWIASAANRRPQTPPPPRCSTA